MVLSLNQGLDGYSIQYLFHFKDSDANQEIELRFDQNSQQPDAALLYFFVHYYFTFQHHFFFDILP